MVQAPSAVRTQSQPESDESRSTAADVHDTQASPGRWSGCSKKAASRSRPERARNSTIGPGLCGPAGIGERVHHRASTRSAGTGSGSVGSGGTVPSAIAVQRGSGATAFTGTVATTVNGSFRSAARTGFGEAHPTRGQPGRYQRPSVVRTHSQPSVRTRSHSSASGDPIAQSTSWSNRACSRNAAATGSRSASVRRSTMEPEPDGPAGWSDVVHQMASTRRPATGRRSSGPGAMPSAIAAQRGSITGPAATDGRGAGGDRVAVARPTTATTAAAPATAPITCRRRRRRTPARARAASPGLGSGRSSSTSASVSRSSPSVIIAVLPRSRR